MRIIVLSDDRVSKQGLIGKHSLSLYIERAGEVYLFGLGVDAVTIEHNARALNVDLDIVDYAVISHEHTPHYGGYKYLSQEAAFTRVYIPFGSLESLGVMLSANGLRPVEVVKQTPISDGVYISKPYYGPPYEIMLVLEYGRGLLVFTGCLHPGLEALLDLSRTANRNIVGLIGGLHLHNAPDSVVERIALEIISRLQLEFIIPLHCTGRRLIDTLKSTKSVEVIEAGAGEELVL
jgi:7,8-dihydropterin-6-yl-methyl-4-(beta-D-ribofuranosyl)aminobenzene 5'-phosphate synthase